MGKQNPSDPSDNRHPDLSLRVVRDVGLAACDVRSEPFRVPSFPIGGGCGTDLQREVLG